ncbi:hypothetical protein KUTeg_006980 [Tegillarca granosa]|uniref:Tubby C-terminal domain-containing protein n=1 Tax=Tegillarca granosa TaxID=220873 RepID=A0ABQ9FEZ1_TEGGR|nr:hypothetical protein KUTeg_006980 [Tegillarca granosa]
MEISIKMKEFLLLKKTAIVENHGTITTSKIVVDVLPSNISTSHIEDNKIVLDSSDSVVNNISVGGEKAYRSPVMKNRTLSPATESLAQNNAFNLESSSVLKDKYISQGAKPKVMNCAYASTGSSPTLECRSTSLTDYTSKDNSAVNGVLRTSLHEEVENIMKTEEENRWADHANCGIKFIDDDKFELNLVPRENTVISDSSQLTPTTSDNRKRLYLESTALKEKEDDADEEEEESTRSCDHRGSIDSSATEEENSVDLLDGSHSDLLDRFSPSLLSGGSAVVNNVMFGNSFEHFNLNGNDIEINQTLSLPASPIRRSPKMDSPTRRLREEVLRGKCKHYSPIFKRKSKYSSHGLDSSDDDVISSAEEIRYSHHYKNLETFQKAQLKQKLRRVRSKSEDRTRYPPLGARQFVMHNKAPLWNENSQVYQLDFGGRVTQESAKNFQIEFRGRQVMQFGRIDSNAYTLDFQYPFTAIQAFAVALANVTQRLK